MIGVIVIVTMIVSEKAESENENQSSTQTESVETEIVMMEGIGIVAETIAEMTETGTRIGEMIVMAAKIVEVIEEAMTGAEESGIFKNDSAIIKAIPKGRQIASAKQFLTLFSMSCWKSSEVLHLLSPRHFRAHCGTLKAAIHSQASTTSCKLVMLTGKHY
mmetsp:Transcript_24080/g.39579  ORF Transcript_24080/g.39579 Transcript_24080/m.39579 type:complete len:161 (-) Transcript_24080:307-789(-)